MEATIGICKCSKDKKPYGIRFEKRKDGWHYNWAFKLNEKSAEREGYGNTKVTGNIICDAEYPGCPTCGAKGFTLCGKCGKLTCWDGNGHSAKCAWCGFEGELTSDVTQLDVTDNL